MECVPYRSLTSAHIHQPLRPRIVSFIREATQNSITPDIPPPAPVPNWILNKCQGFILLDAQMQHLGSGLTLKYEI